MTASRRLAAWLRIDGSLSARIAESAGRLEVRVLRQGPVRLLADEAVRLGCPAGAGAHGREVLLLADGRPVVFARSVLQSVHARGTWKAIRGLGTRSLADMLFGLPAAPRSGFEFARFAPGSAVAVRVQRRWRESTGQAWGRREVWARCSVFTRRGAPLLVTECFAPAIEQLAAPHRARAMPWRPSAASAPSHGEAATSGRPAADGSGKAAAAGLAAAAPAVLEARPREALRVTP